LSPPQHSKGPERDQRSDSRSEALMTCVKQKAVLEMDDRRYREGTDLIRDQSGGLAGPFFDV
jgi:hypothetical protein